MARVVVVALLLATLLAAAPSVAQEFGCLPGSQMTLAGTGPANAQLVARFDQRPVGGGQAGRDGAYRITLLIGRERPGLHVMTVEIRETRDVIQRITCEIPGATGRAAQPSPAGSPTATRPTNAPTATRPTNAPTATPLPRPTYTADPAACDPSYPNFCIQPKSLVGDLNCANIPKHLWGFRVDLSVPNPDPHVLDGNKNGVGCEEPD